MRFEEFCRTLSEKKYAVFSWEEIGLFFPGEKKASIKQALSRWKKSGLVAPLRRGLYELSYPSRQVLPDYYLANRIYGPSYVSLETALSHYGLIPEVSLAVTSVTPKATRRFKAGHGLFTYRSVQPRAFCGITIENHQGYDILIAEPEKALADFMYFKMRKVSGREGQDFRLDAHQVRRLNSKKLEAYGRLYGLETKEALDAYL